MAWVHLDTSEMRVAKVMGAAREPWAVRKYMMYCPRSLPTKYLLSECLRGTCQKASTKSRTKNSVSDEENVEASCKLSLMTPEARG